MAKKGYYWYRLSDQFFEDKHIRKIRSMEDGDTLLIIFLKILKVAKRNEGVIEIDGTETFCYEEIALATGEDADKTRRLLNYLMQVKEAQPVEGGIYFPLAEELVGVEGSSTQRSREFRQRKALQCNTDATLLQHECNTEKRTEDNKKEEKNISQNRILTENEPVETGYPPTIDEIREYCIQKGLKTNPDTLYSYYDDGTWYENGKLRDWKGLADSNFYIA